MIRSIYRYIRENHLSAYIIMSLIIAASWYHNHENKRKLELINEFYGKNQYNPQLVPNGLVIFKAGIPETFNPKMDGDSSLRYEMFRVGVWNITLDVVYEIRVPCYAHTRFQEGMFVHGTPTNKNPERLQPKDSSVVVQPRELHAKPKLFSL